MALTWDLTKIDNYEEVCWKKNDDDTSTLNPATESLIWLSMGIGMGSITESNAEKFYARVSLYEKLNGSMRKIYHDDKPTEHIFVSPEEVIAHIGLRTNVSTETDAQFNKKIVSHSIEDMKRTFRIHLKSMNESVDNA